MGRDPKKFLSILEKKGRGPEVLLKSIFTSYFSVEISIETGRDPERFISILKKRLKK
jgi:hypothetical protein